MLSKIEGVIKNSVMTLLNIMLLLLAMLTPELFFNKPFKPITMLFTVAAVLCIHGVALAVIRLWRFVKNGQHLAMVGWCVLIAGLSVAISQLPENYIYWLVHYHVSPYAGIALTIVSAVVGCVLICAFIMMIRRMIPVLKIRWMKRAWSNQS